MYNKKTKLYFTWRECNIIIKRSLNSLIKIQENSHREYPFVYHKERKITTMFIEDLRKERRKKSKLKKKARILIAKCCLLHFSSTIWFLYDWSKIFSINMQCRFINICSLLLIFRLFFAKQKREMCGTKCFQNFFEFFTFFVNELKILNDLVSKILFDLNKESSFAFHLILK